MSRCRESKEGKRAYFRPAWKSRNVPAEKNVEAMIGTIQWTLAELVQPNQNIEMGRRIAPTMAMGRRSSGTKSGGDKMSVTTKTCKEDDTYQLRRSPTWASERGMRKAGNKCTPISHR